MYHPPFIARQRELHLLDREWRAPDAGSSFCMAAAGTARPAC